MDPMILNAFREFEKCKAFDFRSRILPDNIKSLLEKVCEKYLGGSDTERAEIRRLVRFEISFLFFLFSATNAERAVQMHAKHELNLSVVALLIEDRTFDWRESIIGLSLVYDSACRIGLDADGFLLQTGQISSAEMGHLISGFVNREPEGKAIGKFGFKTGADSSGNFAYIALDWSSFA